MTSKENESLFTLGEKLHNSDPKIIERFEAEYSLHEAGIVKSEVWEKHRVYCNSFICLPAVSTWWESEKEQPICSDSFIKEISSGTKHDALTAGSLSESEA